jgi:N-acetyl-anhydromuramyl-L-alanine amidase AmpD
MYWEVSSRASGMVETWMSTGKVMQQTGDKYLYITQHCAVVVNKTEQVITAFGSKYFDSNMQEVIKELFGK